MLYPVRLSRGSKLHPRSPGRLPLLNQYIPATVVATRLLTVAKAQKVLSHPSLIRRQGWAKMATLIWWLVLVILHSQATLLQPLSLQLLARVTWSSLNSIIPDSLRLPVAWTKASIWGSLAGNIFGNQLFVCIFVFQLFVYIFVLQLFVYIFGNQLFVYIIKYS